MPRENQAPFELDTALLRTVAGCTHALQLIGAERVRVQQLMQEAERPSRTSPSERAWAHGLRAEWERLGLMKGEVKAIRTKLGTDDRLRWERTFVHVAHDVLDEATYQRIADEARARVEAQQRLAQSASVGAALGMRAGTASVRTRA